MRKRFLTLGEIMLRLTPPNYDKISAAASFEAHYGGSEANVAVALANLGADSSYFTVVPDNAIGRTALRTLKSSGVNCAPAILSTPAETPTHRLGAYYLEAGYGVRPSRVVYDRKHSAITEYDLSRIDLDALLDGFDWLHLSGITPALNQSCADFILRCLKTAREKGMTVSFDGNYRSALWSWEAARDYCTQCLPFVDVLLGIEPYHLPAGEGDVKDGLPMQPDLERQDAVFRAFVERWPNLKAIARHVRYAHSGSENSLKAYLWQDGKTVESRLFTFNILDRVGGGDAFAGGLIYSMLHGFSAEDTVNFAVAASVLKHTIRGDASLIDDAENVKSLMNMSFDIKR